MTKTAILIDGGFYRKVAPKLFKNSNQDPKQFAKDLIEYCYKHINDASGNPRDELYRIFYYDCSPLTKKLIHPLTKKEIDYSKTPICKWYNDFIAEMMKQRKVALRTGRLAEENANYIINSSTLKSYAMAQSSSRI